jgi:hypothetical protein
VTRTRFHTILQLALATAIMAGGGLVAQEAEEDQAETVKPGITVEAVVVEPQKPAADTLCKLAVRLQNHGDQMASQLGFKVTINGQEIAVYSNHLFMFPLAAETTGELSLFNFWSTESSRAMPKDGKLAIEVSLIEAKWTTVEVTEGEELWTATGDVPGLPSSNSVVLEMSR